MGAAAKFAPLGIAVAALLLSATAIADATLYRWVDKDGHIHYGDQPSANAQQVNPNRLDGQSSGGNVGGSSSSGGGDASDADAAKKQADCKQKNDALARYQSATSITETDALGNTHEYSADQKDQLIAKTKQYVGDHCGSGDTSGSSTP